ncbi:hypothetical protein [Okeania sp. SIO2G5]|uniref:hypothetical protein n=1 Tax=Okeania sp. SIO2G5 TaxID=2607796 RepID=UPI0013C0631F|nr:hypothetical protein [Okeania sp. SIO2G5]NEP76325.1 hypothetical protein [Okeania sp. SIO2G5]
MPYPQNVPTSAILNLRPATQPSVKSGSLVLIETLDVGIFEVHHLNFLLRHPW